MHGTDSDSEYVRPGPDPARDARVAARRRDDRRKAARALDELIYQAAYPLCGASGVRSAVNDAWEMGWRAGYAESQLQHKGHYGVDRDPIIGLVSGGLVADCPRCGGPHGVEHHDGHYGVAEHDGYCLKAGGECSPEAKGDFRRGDRVRARAESMAPGYHPKVLTVSYVMPIEGTGKRTPLRWQFKAEELPGVWLHCDEYVQHNGHYGAATTGKPHRCATCGEWFETEHAVRSHSHHNNYGAPK